MKSLLKAPFLYPLYGLVYLFLKRPDLGLRALISALLQILNPFMWLSPSLVARSHSKFFNAVFESAVGGGGRGPSSSSVATRSTAAAVTPLSADQRARLDAAVAAATAEADAAAAAAAARARDPLGSLPSPSSSAGEILGWLRWALVEEPEGGGGGAAAARRLPWHLRWLKRTLVAPLYLAFPLAPRLLSIRDTRDVAVGALRPWLKAKGLRVSKGGGGGRRRGAALSIDDACFFSRRRAWECRSFGAVAAALGCVPLLSWLLAFATTAGAALWAADLEQFCEGGSRVLVPPPAVPAPAPATSGGAVGGGGPLQQQAEKKQAASSSAAAAVSASKQEL